MAVISEQVLLPLLIQGTAISILLSSTQIIDKLSFFVHCYSLFKAHHPLNLSIVYVSASTDCVVTIFMLYPELAVNMCAEFVTNESRS